MTDNDRQKTIAIAAEQEYVDALFRRIDGDIDTARARLESAVKKLDTNSPLAEDLVQREVEVATLAKRLDRMNLAQVGLVFGRIDVEDADPENPVPGKAEQDRRYIGRLGVDAPEDHYRTLLLDWRAPAARPYYLATTAQPEGVHVRRHIRMSSRTVTDISDEVLNPDARSETAGGTRPASDTVAGESALFDALNRARTGYMSDIVETIQREQDTIIRDPSHGVMVVEGGPGTGKTAVALHRVAYLLYTWRDQLAKTGVLLLGPNTTFLDYISRVLPELGETGVVLRTVGTLYPGFTPVAQETLLGKEIKGSEEMVTILSAALQRYEVVPDEPITIQLDGVRVAITPAMVKKSRTRARRSRKPHNEARGIFADQLAELTAQKLTEIIGADPLGGDNLLSAADTAELTDELLDEPQFAEVADSLWPELTPEDILAEILSDRTVLDEVAGDYDDETRDGLFRADGYAWTDSDAALVDELAHRIGVLDPEEQRKREEKEWQQQLAEAQEALDVLQSSENTDLDDELEAEILSAHDVIDAEQLARRQQETDNRTTVERASEDYTWAYGHVVVDEAQELTPMEWRMVMRRSPNRWMTLVGDTAQTSAPAGVESWEETLEPFVDKRFKIHRLTVNYRTPAEIMEYANALLESIDPDQEPATAIRETGAPVRFLPAGTDPTAVAQEFSDGRLVQVIDAENVHDIKGLEFDHVILVEPSNIIDNSPQGLQDLYVAATRATQTLTIIGE